MQRYSGNKCLRIARDLAVEIHQGTDQLGEDPLVSQLRLAALDILAHTALAFHGLVPIGAARRLNQAIGAVEELNELLRFGMKTELFYDDDIRDALEATNELTGALSRALGLLMSCAADDPGDPTYRDTRLQ